MRVKERNVRETIRFFRVLAGRIDWMLNMMYIAYNKINNHLILTSSSSPYDSMSVIIVDKYRH